MSLTHFEKQDISSGAEHKCSDVFSTSMTYSNIEDNLHCISPEVIEQVVLSELQTLLDTNEILRTSLVEKESFINDIQHRVKNNFQLITSLINLQADSVTDPLALSLLQKTRDQVMSVAFVYEMSYGTNDLIEMSFGNYLERMLDHLCYSYDVNPERIHLILQAKDVVMSVENAIPCGLIVNELVSNSLKHAFPKGRTGSIWVEMKKESERFSLVIRDNGVSFPSEFKLAEVTTLGLQLVNILTQQLQGKLSLLCESGTEFQIIFPD